MQSITVRVGHTTGKHSARLEHRIVQAQAEQSKERRRGKTAAEKNFENRVKNYLKDKGAWVLKYWGGAAYTKSGIPDLLVCFEGWFLGIELKAPKGKPSELQLYNLREIEKAGGIGILLYPKDYEQFKQFIEHLELGELPVNLYGVYPFLTEWNHIKK